MSARVQEAAFDAAAEAAAFQSAVTQSGAVVSFTGLVREVRIGKSIGHPPLWAVAAR
jgi:molybdopterin synthase catalytic subunit